jgi:hypothetical protein
MTHSPSQYPSWLGLFIATGGSRGRTIIGALLGRVCSAAVQRRGGEKFSKREANKVPTIACFVVLLGELATEWANGRFSSSASM